MTTYEITVPTHCPECHTKLEVLDEDKTGVETSWCVNFDCPGRIRDMFSFIGDRDILEIDGLGPEMSTKLAAEGFARNVGELFSFQNDALEGFTKFGEDKFEKAMARKGFSGAVAVRMVHSLEKAKVATWDRWIATLGIPMVSKSLGRVIATTMKLTPDSMKDLPRLLKEFASLDVPGMGAKKKDFIRDWVSEPRHVRICQELYAAGVRPTPLATAVVGSAGTPLAGIAFCVTGELLELDREKLSSLLESLGATKKSGVSKNCTHLIRLDAPGKSKVAAAEKLGIPIVDKTWVMEQLAKGGISLNVDKFPLDEES